MKNKLKLMCLIAGLFSIMIFNSCKKEPHLSTDRTEKDPKDTVLKQWLNSTDIRWFSYVLKSKSKLDRNDPKTINAIVDDFVILDNAEKYYKTQWILKGGTQSELDSIIKHRINANEPNDITSEQFETYRSLMANSLKNNGRIMSLRKEANNDNDILPDVLIKACYIPTDMVMFSRKVDFVKNRVGLEYVLFEPCDWTAITEFIELYSKLTGSYISPGYCDMIKSMLGDVLDQYNRCLREKKASPGGGGGSPSGGGPSGGGNNEAASSGVLTLTNIQNSTIVADGKNKIDPQKYIKCFEDGKEAKSYKMTIYVNQPNPGTNAQFITLLVGNGLGGVTFNNNGTFFDVGHTFVGFEKINTDGSYVRQVMGFYPSPDGSSLKSKGVIKDDSGHVRLLHNMSASV